MFAQKCSLCRDNIEKGTLCPFCACKLEQLKRRHTQIIEADGRKVEISSLFAYESKDVKKLLFALKQRGNKELFEYASMLYFEAAGETDGTTAVINVPRSAKNVSKYGYDHVAKPIKIMCKKHEGLVYAPVLKRKFSLFPAREQKELDKQSRKRNVRNKFRAVKKDIPKNILLADDVVTTSNTASECIRTLLRTYPDANIKCVFLASTGRNFPAVGKLEN